MPAATEGNRSHAQGVPSPSAQPICGKTMADTMARDRDHDLITEFNLSRFDNYKLVGEKGAAAVGH